MDAVAQKNGAHWRLENSTFLTPGSNHGAIALVWSPWEALAAEGFHVRAGVAAGTWRERVFDSDVPKFHAEATFGWRRAIGPARVTAEIGIHHIQSFDLGVIEPGLIGPVRHPRTSYLATLQAVISPIENGFVSLHARASGAERMLALTLSSGIELYPGGMKLGPEMGLSTGPDGTAWRAGLALTGIRLFEREVALSGGWNRAVDGTSGAYGSVWTAHRF